MSEKYLLKTPSLLLRPITMKDADMIWPYVSNPEISKDMSWQPHKTISDTHAFISDVMKNMADGKNITWCVFYKKKFCGIFSLISILKTHRSLTYNRAELAYWIGPEFQGKGIITEVGKTVIDFAFRKLRLHKLFVAHHVNNTRSKNLILRLGFKFLYEEHDSFMKNGEWISCNFYELNSKDYLKENIMKLKKTNTLFINPDNKLALAELSEHGKKYLRDDAGNTFDFVDGFPKLIFPKILGEKEKHTLDFYEDRANVYDKFLYQTFKTHNEDETKTRNGFIDKLKIKPNSKVLEIACGTGRDSELIAKRLNSSGQLVLQDISLSMLHICKKKLSNYKLDKTYCLSNAAYLPFPDRYFDATYSFGGLGEFPDIKKSLAEMVRVTKLGGKIVVGDESMPPWLRNTYFCKVLSTTNPQFLAELPLEQIPIDARKVNVQWVIGGVFYLIDFEVGDGEPKGNFDYEIEGFKGGTLRTRVEGHLEGVTKETKDLVLKAAKKKGISVHKWIDEVAKKAAKRDLEK